jgi:hypothetical protein
MYGWMHIYQGRIISWLFLTVRLLCDVRHIIFPVGNLKGVTPYVRDYVGISQWHMSAGSVLRTDSIDVMT